MLDSVALCEVDSKSLVGAVDSWTSAETRELVRACLARPSVFRGQNSRGRRRRLGSSELAQPRFRLVERRRDELWSHALARNRREQGE